MNFESPDLCCDGSKHNKHPWDISDCFFFILSSRRNPLQKAYQYSAHCHNHFYLQRAISRVIFPNESQWKILEC